MKKLTIAVSGINSVENPGSGTGIIRSLKEANPAYRCIGLAYDAMEPGIYLDQYVDKAYLLPYPSVSGEKYFERLFYICEKEKVDIIIPAFDSELPHYIKNAKRLAEKKIGLILPNKEQFERTQKMNLQLLAEKIGIKTPATFTVSSLEELNSALEITGFPVMIKGCFYEAHTARSYNEAHSCFEQLAKKWGLPVLAQQFLEGNDYNLIGLSGKEGTSLGMVPIKKLLLTQQGKIWAAVSIDNPRLVETGKEFIKATRFTGGFELEFCLTAKEELYLLEINPRFPAWVYLATACGINLPERYVQNLTKGKKEFSNKYKIGKLLIRYVGELIRDIADFEKITVTGERI
ncbi:MAG: ATP-grasp domain-containing protein [Candidatus Firestonebacteria bacterium]